jgi:nitrogen fixation-related uncharacterized protein
MDVVPLLVFCSLFLAAAGVGMFVFSLKNKEPDHLDRLSLLPLEDDEEPLEEAHGVIPPDSPEGSKEES